ncbi:MAG: PaaI family thioesterase [Burkholderiaceae bacterium]|nr:PaaI family thioesterase [Burkholderiaceae bacterium]MDO9089978.1 PaaI family thioesterase [Burkholderiaceae bacterium]MDP1969094.1 PaaI family thioesterase [Burkholderiaceae bacterium]
MSHTQAVRGAGTHKNQDKAPLSAADLDAMQREFFAPWVQALGMRVESVGAASVTLRLPQSDSLSRMGGTLCGQAMMAAADSAMVLALVCHFGEFRPCTTVQLSSSFLKPLSAQDALVEARVLRAGKSMAFGEIDIRGAQDGKSVCRATTAYALL